MTLVHQAIDQVAAESKEPVCPECGGKGRYLTGTGVLAYLTNCHNRACMAAYSERVDRAWMES